MEIILFSNENETKLTAFSFPLIETKLNRLLQIVFSLIKPKLIHIV